MGKRLQPRLLSSSLTGEGKAFWSLLSIGCTIVLTMLYLHTYAFHDTREGFHAAHDFWDLCIKRLEGGVVFCHWSFGCCQIEIQG